MSNRPKASVMAPASRDTSRSECLAPQGSGSLKESWESSSIFRQYVRKHTYKNEDESAFDPPCESRTTMQSINAAPQNSIDVGWRPRSLFNKGRLTARQLSAARELRLLDALTSKGGRDSKPAGRRLGAALHRLASLQRIIIQLVVIERRSFVDLVDENLVTDAALPRARSDKLAALPPLLATALEVVAIALAIPENLDAGGTSEL